MIGIYVDGHVHCCNSLTQKPITTKLDILMHFDEYTNKIMVNIVVNNIVPVKQ